MSGRGDVLGLPCQGVLIPSWHLKLRLRLIFFFLSATFKVVSISRGSCFSEKFYFFNFLGGWWKVGFMAVHLSTLKQKIMFFFKLACCKEYLLIYSFVRRVISSTAITNVFLDNKQERDHLCAFDLGANYRKFHTLEKGYGDPFLHIFCQSLSV